MPSSVISPFEIAATAIQTVIATEFAEEGFTAIFDNIHESLGRDRVDIGIAPDYDAPANGNALVQETYLVVKFYGLWTEEISPDTMVDPTQITRYAERLRRALLRTKASTPNTDEVWFFDVRRVSYPDDPTGNKSRFTAQVRALGNNAGVVETGA